MAFPQADTLAPIVEKIAEQHHLDVETLAVKPAGAKTRVLIAVDGDTRPDLDLLEIVSKQISEAFDAAEDRGELRFGNQEYALEVSTPGVDLPLTLARHWRRNQGRIAVVVVEGKKQRFRIGALNDAEDAVMAIETKGKTLTSSPRPLVEVSGATGDVEFKQPPAAELELAQAPFED